MIQQAVPTDEYTLSRLGCVTASEIKRLLTPPKDAEAKNRGELGKEAKEYVREKIAEIITGTFRSFSNAATDHGEMYEAEAVAELAKLYPGIHHYGGNDRQFFKYTDFSGGSPDAIHGLTLVFEIKCPENPANHVEYMLMEKPEDLLRVKPEYYWQIQMNMLVMAKHHGIEFMEMRGAFVSYYPYTIDEATKLKLLHILPDASFPERLDAALEAAEKYAAAITARLKRNKITE